MRRVVAAHSVAEYDLHGDRAEAARVVGSFKGKDIVLVGLGPLAAQVAHETLPDSPLVVAMVPDLARLKIVGPTVAGIAYSLPVRNQLAAFRVVYPRGVRLGVIYNADNSVALVQEAQKAAAFVHMVLVTRTVNVERDIPVALRALLSGDDAVDALWLIADPVLLGEESRRLILSETIKAGRPVFTFSPALVAEGALASQGPELGSIGEMAGDLVNRLAAGERKIELQMPRAELTINTKIASRLKIEIPPETLKDAKRF
jgi:ABC-type uncharacterized transport system substrate-binding protein